MGLTRRLKTRAATPLCLRPFRSNAEDRNGGAGERVSGSSGD